MNAIQQLRLRNRRLSKCGKLETWATWVRISKGQLSRIERGEVTRVDYRVLERIKQVYGVTDAEVRKALRRAGEV